MREVPKLDGIDMSFGNVKHLPPMKEIPDEFQNHSNKYCRFVSSWFFGGKTTEDMQCLVAREGVDRRAAIIAIKSVLTSFEPQHEHKEAGAAYLLSEWFELHDRPQLSSENSIEVKGKTKKRQPAYQQKQPREYNPSSRSKHSEVKNPKFDMYG